MGILESSSSEGGNGMSTEASIYLFWICLFLGIFLILEAAQ